MTESFGPLTPLLRHPTGGPVKPVLTKIAKRVTESNPSLPIPVDEVVVLLLWTRAMGVVAVTASGNEERIKLLAEISYLPENILTKEEVQKITSVGKTVHFRHYVSHLSPKSLLSMLIQFSERTHGERIRVARSGRWNYLKDRNKPNGSRKSHRDQCIIDLDLTRAWSNEHDYCHCSLLIAYLKMSSSDRVPPDRFMNHVSGTFRN